MDTIFGYFDYKTKYNTFTPTKTYNGVIIWTNKKGFSNKSVE